MYEAIATTSFQENASPAGNNQSENMSSLEQHVRDTAKVSIVLMSNKCQPLQLV